MCIFDVLLCLIIKMTLKSLVTLIFYLGTCLADPLPIQGSNFLQVQGRDFYYKGEKVYLSGTNPAWIRYGNDFGNDQWHQDTNVLWTEEIVALGNAGANSVRVWVHIEGEQNPEFDSNGYVISTDSADTLISDLREFLDLCQANGIFMNLVLWNGALMRPEWYYNLFFDDSKLQSYIDYALIPMVNGLKDHPALGAWEVINEPEGSMVNGFSDPGTKHPCFDLTHLSYARDSFGRAPGWTGRNIPPQNMLKFINWQAAAIHDNDPKALISVGSWSIYAQTDSQVVCEDAVFKCGFNHYKDECLIKAGGKESGIMNFWQMHAYFFNGQWQYGQPWSGVTGADYNMDAPLVFGEFPTSAYAASEGSTIPDGLSTEQLVEYLYNNGYQGGWSWDYGENNSAQEDQG